MQIWEQALSSIKVAGSPWDKSFAFCTLLYERYVSDAALALGADIYEMKGDSEISSFHSIMTTCRLARQIGFEGLKRKFEIDRAATLADNYISNVEWKRPQLDEQAQILRRIEEKLRRYRTWSGS